MNCALCGRELRRDICGPIEGGHVWIREGETRPSPHVEGEAGEWRFACDDCVKGAASGPR